jgi:hypothetical protein
MDLRKLAILDHLRQLSIDQLMRILEYREPILTDTYNYKDGRFCALAVALNLPEIVKNPSHEIIYSIIALSGYSICNLKEIPGTFYTTNRSADLIEATREVLREKVNAI